MKRIILSIVLMLVLCMPLTAAMAAGSVAVNDVSLSDGSYLKNGDNTVYTGALPESGYAHYKGGVLTLNNFKGEGINISAMGNVTIRLVGDNSLTHTYGTVIKAEETNLTITGEDGSLTVEATSNASNRRGIYVYDGSLSILNCSLTVTCKNDDCISVIDYKGHVQLLVQNSALVLSSGESGIYAENITIENSDVEVDAKHEALGSKHMMSLTGSNFRLTTYDPDCPLIHAADGLYAPGMPLIYVEWPTFASQPFYTIGDENGPFSSYVFNAPPELPSPPTDDRIPPRTGDSTSIALLAALCLLSLTGVVILRKRSA